MEALLKCPFRRLWHRRHYCLTAPGIYLWLHNYVNRGHVSLDCTVQWLNKAKLLVPSCVCLLQDPLLNICFRKSPLLWLGLSQNSVGVWNVSQAGPLCYSMDTDLHFDLRPLPPLLLSIPLSFQAVLPVNLLPIHSHTDICSENPHPNAPCTVWQ